MKISKKEGLTSVKIEHNRTLFWIIIVLLAILIGLTIYLKVRIYNETNSALNNTINNSSGLANPASVYCIQHNGSLQIKVNLDGSQYGVCVFADKTSCDEWAFYRGECGARDSSNSCSNNEDCVAASCCHANSCVNARNAPNCRGIACTMSCEPGTLDCGQGSCVCNKGKCEVRFI